jgi:hypothetical protein
MRFGGYRHPKVGGIGGGGMSRIGTPSGFRIRGAASGRGGLPTRTISPYAGASRLTSRATGMANPAGSKVGRY